MKRCLRIPDRFCPDAVKPVELGDAAQRDYGRALQEPLPDHGPDRLADLGLNIGPHCLFHLKGRSDGVPDGAFELACIGAAVDINPEDSTAGKWHGLCPLEDLVLHGASPYGIVVTLLSSDCKRPLVCIE